MSEIEKIRLFDNQQIRTVWVEEEEEWYFSVKDVVTILTETTNAKDYISKMRRRDEELSKGWGQIVLPPLGSDCNIFIYGATDFSGFRLTVVEKI